MFTIRAICSPDPDALDELNAIERRAARQFPAGRIPDPMPTLTPAFLRSAGEAGLLFVACLDGQRVAHRRVGFAAGRIQGPFLHLSEVSVDPDFGRRGIGRGLVERIVKASRERHLRGTTLTTFSDLPWNRPFYESIGFRVIEGAALTAPLAAALAAERQQGLIRRVAMLLSNPPAETIREPAPID